MSIRQTASFQIGAALLVGLLSTVFVTWLAMSQPWSGLTLSVPSDGIGLLVQVDETGPSAALPRFRTHNQNMTVAARAIAERKTVGDLS